MLSNLRPPLSAFTSSFRHQESAGFEDLKLKVYFRGCAGSTRQKRLGSDRANLSQYGRLKHARTHARVCEGTRNSKGARSTAAAAFANPDASPESTPTRRSPDPAAAPRGADDALPSGGEPQRLWQVRDGECVNTARTKWLLRSQHTCNSSCRFLCIMY